MDASRELRETGYVVVHGCLTRAVCDAAIKRIDDFKIRTGDAVARNSDEFGHLYRVVNLHLAIDELADAFAGLGPALDVTDAFFGAATSLYTSLYYERGSEQALHRDSPYFCTKPAYRYLGMWLALDDVDDSNGQLRVAVRSHTLPGVDLEKMGREVFGDLATIPPISDEGWARYQNHVQRQGEEAALPVRDVIVQKGDVIIWHPQLLHGGAPQKDRTRSRRSLVMHVTPEGVPVYHMDVFFNPGRLVSDRAPWTYFQVQGRKIASFDQVDFGHQYTVPVSQLR
jgi:Phytanoyl-CoA dioxygenase (PhyH)